MQKIYLPSELHGCLSGLDGIMPSRIDSVYQSASSPVFHKMKLTTISSSYFKADVNLSFCHVKNKMAVFNSTCISVWNVFLSYLSGIFWHRTSGFIFLTNIDYTTKNVKIKELCKIQLSKIVKIFFLIL